MSKRHIFVVSALLLAGTNGAALAQQGADGRGHVSSCPRWRSGGIAAQRPLGLRGR